MVELGIVDIREIVRIIKKVHGYDFSNFALTSFKYNLEKVIARNNLVNAENLFRRLSDDISFFDTFLHDIYIPSTEMFRDPSLWRWLREEYFPKLSTRHFDNFKIWLPNCVSGAELYSICILLKEIDLLDKVKIYASVKSTQSIEYIKSGIYPLKKLEVSIENYKRFHGTLSMDSYYTIEHSEAFRDKSLIKSVEFIKDDLEYNNPPKNVKLILFRNVLIYYNPSRQATILEKMHQHLSASGCLILGVKEIIKPSANAAFEMENEGESVYKRVI